jgi:hypothetical protein
MTIALILTAAWVVVMTMAVIACRMAAKGDRALAAAAKSNATRWEDELLRPGGWHAVAGQIRAYRGQNVEGTALQTAAREHVRDRAQQDLDVGP